MALYGRKKRNRIILFVVITIFILAFGGITYYYQMQNSQGDAEKGQIHSIEGGEDIANPKEPTPGSKLQCVIMDVGDAQAVLIDYGATEILVDTGYYETRDKVLSVLDQHVNGEIEYMILSHSHADHCGAADAILKDYKVGTIITSGEKKGESKQFDYAKKAVDKAKKQGTEVVDDSDLTYNLGDDVTLSIIEGLDPEDTSNPNDMSVAVFVKYMDKTIFIPGDNEKEGETALLGKVPPVTLLIAGHHFSSTASNKTPLAEWTPQIVVGSYAKDSQYGFPHKEAVARCLVHTRDIYSTAISGDIIYTIDPSEEGQSTISAPEEDILIQ